MRGNARGGRAALALAIALAPAAAWAAGTGSEGARLAYVDPGSGSFLLQALFAVLAGAVVAAQQYWTRLKRLLGSGPDARDEDRADG